MNPLSLHKLSYGMYIVSSFSDQGINGQIANTVFQITSQPPSVAVSINKENLTHRYIEESRKFSVSVLEKDTPIQLIGRFGFKSGRNISKFENLNYVTGKSGVPIVMENTLAYLELTIISQLDAGTHTVFLGEVLDAEIVKAGEMLTYDYYHLIKKGNAPKTAPTYLANDIHTDL